MCGSHPWGAFRLPKGRLHEVEGPALKDVGSTGLQSSAPPRCAMTGMKNGRFRIPKAHDGRPRLRSRLGLVLPYLRGRRTRSQDTGKHQPEDGRKAKSRRPNGTGKNGKTIRL